MRPPLGLEARAAARAGRLLSAVDPAREPAIELGGRSSPARRSSPSSAATDGAAASGASARATCSSSEPPWIGIRSTATALSPCRVEQVLERREREVAEVLVVDGVELAALDHVADVGQLERRHAVRRAGSRESRRRSRCRSATCASTLLACRTSARFPSAARRAASVAAEELGHASGCRAPRRPPARRSAPARCRAPARRPACSTAAGSRRCWRSRPPATTGRAAARRRSGSTSSRACASIVSENDEK